MHSLPKHLNICQLIPVTTNLCYFIPNGRCVTNSLNNANNTTGNLHAASLDNKPLQLSEICRPRGLFLFMVSKPRHTELLNVLKFNCNHTQWEIWGEVHTRIRLMNKMVYIVLRWYTAFIKSDTDFTKRFTVIENRYRLNTIKAHQYRN